MALFFKNNFSEDRWRKAALKNAFSLLGKQKFERAAAFFLLGGAVKDAIEVLQLVVIKKAIAQCLVHCNSIYQYLV